MSAKFSYKVSETPEGKCGEKTAGEFEKIVVQPEAVERLRVVWGKIAEVYPSHQGVSYRTKALLTACFIATDRGTYDGMNAGQLLKGLMLAFPGEDPKAPETLEPTSDKG